MKTIQSILCPVDMSEASKNAFQYAQSFARAIGARLVLLHSYQPMQSVSAPVILTPASNDQERAAHFFKHFLGDEERDSNIELQVELGPPVATIVEESQKHDLLILATKREHFVEERWFGTISSEVVRSTTTPALIIPEGAAYQPVREIIYATDFDNGDPKAMEEVTDLAFQCQAHVTMVHVDTEGKEELPTTPKQANALPTRDGVNIRFSHTTVHSESVHQGLERFVEESHGNILVMLKQRYSFLESLFHTSKTRRMALYTRKPLLILHEA